LKIRTVWGWGPYWRVMRRVAVVGCIGSGKSTVARRMGDTLGVEVFHLDRVWWRPGQYTIRGADSVAAHTMPSVEFRHLEESIVERDSWIIDGGMANVDVRLSRADTVVFLDLSRWRCLIGLVKRHNRRRPDYPDEVTESLAWFWLLARWIWTTWPHKRRPGLISKLEGLPSEVNVVRLYSRRDIAEFLPELVANRG
jgi:adenylate kinase family enzyme